MTTKELINQYVTAHADNRWMDASELEALLTEFAEKLQEPASEDFESEWKRYCDSKGSGAVTMNLKDVAKHFAQWQREQMMRYAVPSYYHKKYINDKGDYFPFVTYADMDDLKRVVEDLKLKDGDNVKVIIIKE